MFKKNKKIAALLSMSLAIISISSLAADAQGLQLRQPEKIRPTFPSLSMSGRQAAGQAAVDQLGTNLNAVAAWYGKSASDLRKELLSDRRMRVDKNGRLLAVEEIDAPVPADPASASQGAIQEGSLVGLDQTFALHSRPGAARTIYLDFNGATITNTAWNSNGNTITAQPYDIDNNPAVFSTTELQRLQFIWQRVAEDYAPFDVDVTTQQPDPAALTRSGSADGVFGTTVVVTRTDGVYSCSCGGIAYVGVFNYSGGSNPPDYYKPALVFYNMLGSGDEKAVAEAISHEAGHNMGLHHDGTSTVTYYGGQGADPVTGWAPIMGVGYYKPLVQFSKGEYGDANNKEDDFAIAQSFGLPLRTDDFGNTIATAAALPATVSAGVASSTIDGVIESAADRDVFAIASGAGAINVSVDPASRSANADLVITLMDAGGNVLASANPLNSLRATLSTNVQVQGNYYLEVKGSGQGDPATSGYSSYGSVGNFRVTASYVAPTGNAPAAVISANVSSGVAPLAVTFDGSQSTDDGHVAFWYWDFGDGSGDQTGSLSSVTHAYSTAGTYVARLLVVDDTGLSSAATQTIVVSSAVPQASVQVIGMQLKLKRTGKSASAVVTVLGPNGSPIKGAAVRVTWSGAVSMAASKTTARTGQVVLASPASNAGGCFILTITGVTTPSYSFSGVNLPTAQVCG
ncbi:PKD domain-containing protein [Aestuariivirga sp.]|uniref:PKD domain-containing protein n=1 Tax=Aestuariivirga sp. TaxID=2650926 RepID=UPI0030184498